MKIPKWVLELLFDGFHTLSLSLSLWLSNKKRTKISFEVLVCKQKYNIRNLEFESHQISSRLFGLCFLFLCIDRQQKLCQTPLKKKKCQTVSDPIKKKIQVSLLLSKRKFLVQNSLQMWSVQCRDSEEIYSS